VGGQSAISPAVGTGLALGERICIGDCLWNRPDLCMLPVLMKDHYDAIGGIRFVLVDRLGARISWPIGGGAVVFDHFAWVSFVDVDNWRNQRGVGARPTLTDSAIAVVGCLLHRVAAIHCSGKCPVTVSLSQSRGATLVGVPFYQCQEQLSGQQTRQPVQLTTHFCSLGSFKPGNLFASHEVTRRWGVRADTKVKTGRPFTLSLLRNVGVRSPVPSSFSGCCHRRFR
jgi:hypothetical protein